MNLYVVNAAEKCVADAKRYPAISGDKARMTDNRELLMQSEEAAVVSK